MVKITLQLSTFCFSSFGRWISWDFVLATKFSLLLSWKKMLRNKYLTFDLWSLHWNLKYQQQMAEENKENENSLNVRSIVRQRFGSSFKATVWWFINIWKSLEWNRCTCAVSNEQEMNSIIKLFSEPRG